MLEVPCPYTAEDLSLRLIRLKGRGAARRNRDGAGAAGRVTVNYLDGA